MKTIVVKWIQETEFGYGKAMRVIESGHERFTLGSRFDFDFFGIATDEGYTIISLPMDEQSWEKDSDMVFTAISTGNFDNFEMAQQAVFVFYIPDMSISGPGISHALKRLERFYADGDLV